MMDSCPGKVADQEFALYVRTLRGRRGARSASEIAKCIELRSSAYAMEKVNEGADTHSAIGGIN